MKDTNTVKKAEEATRLHSKIMTNLAEGIYLIRMNDLEIVWANHRFEEMFGYNPGEMIGKSATIVNAPTDKTPEETASNIVDILERTGEWHGEVNNIKKDGTPFWCYANVSIFNHPEYGKVLVSVHSDITERKKALEALRENEEKLKSFMESATEGFIIYDSEFKLSEINEAALGIIGMTREEMIGKHMLELSPGLENTGRYDSYLNVVETSKSFHADDIVPHPKYGNLYLSINAFKIAEGLGMIFNDVTERKKAEQELKESEHNLRERFKELTCLYGLSKLVENPDISLEAIIQGTLDSIPPTWQFPEITCARINFDNKEFKTNSFKESKWKLSTTIDIHEKVMIIEVYYLEDKPFLKEEESLISDLGYRLKSIIEQKETQKKLKKSESRYRDAYERAEFYKDLFAHDISNILQNIKSSLGLLSMWQNDLDKINKVNEIMGIVNDQVIRGSNLVSNIRRLSEISEAEDTLESTEVGQVLNKAIKFVNKSFPGKDISFEADSRIKDGIVKANKLLVNVFENLLFNAIKYNESPKIKILTRVSKETKDKISYVKVEFIDNGIGVPDVMKEHIFKGIAGRKEKVHGMGLGLLLVKKALESYNGEISVEDKVKGDHSKGSKFIILIPEVS